MDSSSNPISPEIPVIDQERQEQARRYARISRRVMLLELLAAAALTTAWLALGWSISLQHWIQTISHNPWVAVAVVGLVIGASHLLLSLPLSYYSGFILPHRFKQSNQTLQGWLQDQIKGLLLSAGLGLILLEIIYALLRQIPEIWWLLAGGVLLLFNVLLATLAPVLLMPLFYQFIPLDEEHLDLSTRLLQLAEKAGTRVMGVYRFDLSRRTKSANAGLTGLGATRRIILGDTLLEEFSAEEIETVLAHELGHHKNRDILLGLMVQTTLTLGGLYLTSLLLNWSAARLGFTSIADPAALPLLALWLGAYGLVTTPISNTYSRWRENLADRFALEITSNGQAFASALIRLSNQNLADVDPEPWVEFTLMSHPALSKRIQRARNFSRSANQEAV